MAAYETLVSLVHIIEQIQHHPRPPFYLDNKHAQCLIEKVTSLQEFLEHYSHVRDEEVKRLESRIAEAAYAAEDLIETHVVDQILAQSAQHGRRICSVDFYQDLQKVMQDMDFIRKEVAEIKERMGSVKEFQQHIRSSMPAADSSRSPPPGQNIMEGRDDVLEHIMDKLTRKQHSNLQVIPIVGMGGMGKTTLAKSVYENPFIVQHFNIRAWATISHEYSKHKILLELLLCIDNQDRESLSRESEGEVRDRLYKSLYTKAYLIILDDMWDINAWDRVKSSFPNNNYGSRIIITTRQSNVAVDLTSGCGGNIIEMNFLNDDISWNLLCKIVFGSEDGCPPKLKDSGRKIAENCGGLPLAIVVIGGLLANSEKTAEYWEYISQNLHSLDENERCLNVLHTSYIHLPVHLKPCFLYMGIFGEDAVIDVKTLILYWVGEGFLKLVSDERLEEAAAGYVKELGDRNLILVEKRKYNGEIKSCKLHDLLLDLCLREIEKHKFFAVIRQQSLNNSQSINTLRRVAIWRSISEVESQHNFLQICDALQSASLARTLICDNVKAVPFPNSRLLRVLAALQSSQEDDCSISNYIFQLVNSRFFFVGNIFVKSHLPSSIYLFWNLQILCIGGTKIISFDIWKMPLLRLVVVHGGLHLRNPGQDGFVLQNLHELSNATNFRCSEKVVKRILNIKTLVIYYGDRFIGSRYCLNNLACLHKLEELRCEFMEIPPRSELVPNLTFPHCLKKLILKGCRLQWEDVSTKIGSLPLLQVLKLLNISFIGSEWETIEEQFSSLKVLKIYSCEDLKCWKTEDSHFPCLERLVLEGLDELEEIPTAIGHIATLRLIDLSCCSYSAVISAKEIAKEQLEELENQDLRVRVEVKRKEYEEVMNWASPNFEVSKW